MSGGNGGNGNGGFANSFLACPQHVVLETELAELRARRIRHEDETTALAVRLDAKLDRLEEHLRELRAYLVQVADSIATKPVRKRRRQ